MLNCGKGQLQFVNKSTLNENNKFYTMIIFNISKNSLDRFFVELIGTWLELP